MSNLNSTCNLNSSLAIKPYTFKVSGDSDIDIPRGDIIQIVTLYNVILGGKYDYLNDDNRDNFSQSTENKSLNRFS